MSEPLKGPAAAEFEIERLQKACAEKDAEIARLKQEIAEALKDYDGVEDERRHAVECVETAEARATAAERERDLRITDHALLVDSYRELETDLLIVREKLVAAEQERSTLTGRVDVLQRERNEIAVEWEIVREKLAAAEQREAEKDARIAHLETELDHAVRFGDGATFSEPIALASPSTPSPTSALAEHCAECGEPVPQPPGYWVICQTCAATAKALLAKAKEPQP